MLKPRHFLRKLHGQRVFFPSDYDIKSQKEDESEKKYLVDKIANDWAVTLRSSNRRNYQIAFRIYFDIMIMIDNCIDNHHQYNY